MADKITRIARKQAVGMDELVTEFIREMRLSTGLNRQRIFAAWDAVSGAAAHTIGRFYKDGILYCTISSSVVRSQLYFQRATILDMLNEELRNDSLYDPEKGFVKAIVLR